MTTQETEGTEGTQRTPPRRGRPAGRRAGDPSAREAILAAARRRFADHGFARATIRAIATDVGVDPALVMHYYGSKADLFAATVQFPIVPSQALAGVTSSDPDHLGEMLLRTVLGIWNDPDSLDTWLSMIRVAATDERVAATFREFLTEALVRPVSQLLDHPDAERRVWLAVSQVVGLGVARYLLGIEPLASISDDDLVATVAPTLQRYLTGDLPPRDT